MAEARNALTPKVALGLHTYQVDPQGHTLQFALTSDGLILYVPHVSYLFRNLRRHLRRQLNNFQSALWPVHPLQLLVLNAAVAAAALRTPHFTGVLDLVPSILRQLDGLAVQWLGKVGQLPASFRITVQAFLLSTAGALCISAAHHLALRGVLHYKGWLYEGATPSRVTKLWALTTRLLYQSWRGPLTFGFQDVLPRQSVPSLEHTCKLFMTTVEPLISAEEFSTLQCDMESFLQNEGPRLQKYLILKSWISDNYVSDWWLKFCYLRPRSPILINSNIYGIGHADTTMLRSPNQVATAASLMHQFCRVKQQLDCQTLPPLLLNNVVPLCMAQYDKAFSTTRIPGKDCDVLVKYDVAESRHVVVLCKGIYFRVNMFNKQHRLLSMYEIQAVLQGIVDYVETINPEELGVEARLAALTSDDRSTWADVREKHFSYGANRASLNVIERAMFVVHLDDRVPKDWSERGNLLLHGGGHTRWCDKSFSLVVFANGLAGIHVEHSWGDAPVIAHIFELCLARELAQTEYRYSPTDGSILPRTEGEAASGANMRQAFRGMCGGVYVEPIEVQPATQKAARPAITPAGRLLWQITPELKDAINSSMDRATKAIQDLFLVVGCNETFGKEAIKGMKCSPDAFVQMALQLAYYRDQGKFTFTYESSLNRLFRTGRTETIRSASKESCAWARAMENPEVSKAEKIKLLQRAAKQHSQYTKDAMSGRAVDRHLFALYVVSVGKGVESPFLKQALSKPWRLSTSQVPQRQTPKNTWPGNDQGNKYFSPSGGFGPVADDGYGVSYAIVGDNRIFFHVSSKRSAGNTDSERFLKQILKALSDMRALF